jgi:hypothetical protein
MQLTIHVQCRNWLDALQRSELPHDVLIFRGQGEDDSNLSIVIVYIGEILQSYLWAKLRHMWRHTNNTYINPHVRPKGRAGRRQPFYSFTHFSTYSQRICQAAEGSMNRRRRRRRRLRVSNSSLRQQKYSRLTLVVDLVHYGNL